LLSAICIGSCSFFQNLVDFYKVKEEKMHCHRKWLLLFPAFTIILLTGCATKTAAADKPPVYDKASIAGSPSAASDQMSVTRLMLTREAATYMRTPYASPPTVPVTFDCSGFVSHVYAQFGYKLPTSTRAYIDVGTRIDWKDAQPGDILVFSREKGSAVVDHVAMLWKKSDSGELAGSLIIHAASINTGVSMQRGNPDTRIGIVITQLGLRGDGIIENEYFYRRFMFCTRVFKE
jgi:cell wall-associated NlpC family hydrolase